MSTFKPHPFVLALQALHPVIFPSFTLRSVRDRESNVSLYPLIDYVIIAGQTKVYDKSKRRWRTNHFIQLDFLLKETKKPEDWCKYEELADAQDRQSLFWLLENKVEQFLTLLIDPTGVSKEFRFNDMIYANYDLRLENYIGTIYQNKTGKDKLTGISSRFVISSYSDDGSGCCLIDGTVEQWQRLQNLTEPDSVSWKLIQNQIDAL